MQESGFVTKASGEKCLYSEKKIRTSLLKSGASEEQADFILKEIKAKLFEGISTKKIYDIAFSLLKKKSRYLAARYHLKKAIMELGPSGFPFEKYFSEILNRQGYKTKVGEIMQGQCVSHEIDVIAERENHYCIIECKYHNQRGTFSDVKIPLYINSRFKDVESTLKKLDNSKLYEGWVVTNTKFSFDAIQYGNCVGLKLIGWDYPIKGSLKERIDTLGLYPITCLTSLTIAEKRRLLDHRIVLCSEICNNEKLLETMNIKPDRIYNVLKEAKQICSQLSNELKVEC